MEHAIHFKCNGWKTYSYPVPPNTGTLFYNYKGIFSIVLLAICDVKHNFTIVDIGQYGSNNDSGILANRTVAKKFSNDTMNIPTPSSIEGCYQTIN